MHIAHTMTQLRGPFEAFAKLLHDDRMTVTWEDLSGFIRALERLRRNYECTE